MNDSVKEVRPTVENRRKHNVCGECQACCWHFTVPEMDKPRKAPCRHQCDAGCAIHDQPRPAMCTGFRCCWLDENWDASLRPDRSRIIWQRRGQIPDRCGRPHAVYQGDLLDRYAYLRRENERLRKKLTAAFKIVCVGYTNSVGETAAMSWKNDMAFPGLRTADVMRHIRTFLKRFDTEAYESTVRFNKGIRDGL